MTNISSMSFIMIMIIVIVGGIAVVKSVNYLFGRSEFSYQNTALIDVVVLVMYILACGFTGLLYIYAGYDSSVVYAMIALFVLVLFILFMVHCVKNRVEINKVYLVLFVLYILGVLYLTIFMRIGTVNYNVETAVLDDLRQAIMNRDVSMMQHMILNILFFIPFGFLISAMNQKYFNKWFFILLGGLMTSTLIEGVQMIFMIGEADVDDMIANTLGAMIGYGITRFVWQVQKNWKW